MRRTWKFTAAACTIALAVCFTACGSSGGAQESSGTAAAAETSAAESSSEAEAVTVNEAAEPVVIEADHPEELQAFASKMQGFEVPEGTPITITGVWSKPGMTASIMQEKEAGEKWGIQMIFDYDQEDLADGTPITASGYAVKGSYYTEFHIPEGGLTILE